jgi:hypothetical protein
MRQPMLKEEEHTEADLEYGNQRKAMMDLKEELSNVHCMVANITAAVMGWGTGAIIFGIYYTYLHYACPAKDLVLVISGTIPA